MNKAIKVVPAGSIALLLCAALCAQTFDGKDIGVFENHKFEDRWVKRRAVIVGVEKYDSLAPLGYAEDDAEDLAAQLRRAGWLVTLMTAKAENNLHHPDSVTDIEKQVRQMSSDAGPKDTVLFFFSGHGFLGPKDVTYVTARRTKSSDQEDLLLSGLSLSSVITILEQGKAARRLVVVDACRNNPHARPTSQKPGFGSMPESSDTTALLFSAQEGKLSWEPNPGLKDHRGRTIENGIFSHYFLLGLEGEAEQNGDGVISFRELAYFVSQEMEKLRPVVQEQAGAYAAFAQKPRMSWDGSPILDVALVPVDRERTGASSTDETRPTDEARPRIQYRKLSWAKAIRNEPDPKVVTDPAIRESIERTRLPWAIESTDDTAMRMVLIPPGSYRQGGEFPNTSVLSALQGRRTVRFTRPIYVGVHEVTNAQYRIAHPEHRTGHPTIPLLINSERQPVMSILPAEAAAFSTRFGFRLLSEAEWEYVARGGRTTRFPWGDDPEGASRYANVGDKAHWQNSGWESTFAASERAFGLSVGDFGRFPERDAHHLTAPVGSFKPNGFGVYDMIGNAAEWCADHYDPPLTPFASSAVTDPTPRRRGMFGLFRGGCYSDPPMLCRPSYRVLSGNESPFWRLRDIAIVGFRVARTP